MSRPAHWATPSGLMTLLLIMALLTTAGSVAAITLGHPVLAAVLCTLSVLYVVATVLLAVGCMAAPPQRADESAGLVQAPGKHIVDGASAITLPEVSP